MKRLCCKGCYAMLRNDEIALNLKLRGRSIGTFFCLHCLALRVDSAPEALLAMAAFFRENGCELFEHNYVNE